MGREGRPPAALLHGTSLPDSQLRQRKRVSGIFFFSLSLSPPPLPPHTLTHTHTHTHTCTHTHTSTTATMTTHIPGSHTFNGYYSRPFGPLTARSFNCTATLFTRTHTHTHTHRITLARYVYTQVRRSVHGGVEWGGLVHHNGLCHRQPDHRLLPYRRIGASLPLPLPLPLPLTLTLTTEAHSNSTCRIHPYCSVRKQGVADVSSFRFCTN
jgi:hypothetical protein